MMIEHRRSGGLLDLPVADVMSHPVFTVTSEAVLADVLAGMVRTGRRHLAVVDVAGRCIGIVGDRTVAGAWAANPTAMGFVTVRRVLDSRPALVGEDASVRDAAQVMYLDGVDAVAVIDRDGCPVGVLTGGDLIALLATEPQPSVPQPTEPQPPADASDEGSQRPTERPG